MVNGGSRRRTTNGYAAYTSTHLQRHLQIELLARALLEAFIESLILQHLTIQRPAKAVNQSLLCLFHNHAWWQCDDASNAERSG